MEISAATTPFAALCAGMAVSVHCAAMCGPLACAVRARPASYHFGRFVSYTVTGALCGGIGESAGLAFHWRPIVVMPWLLVAVLLVLAFGWERRIAQPRFVSGLLLRMRLSRTLGWVTPLIPCGPLWLIFGVAVVSGSWMRGAVLTGCFVLGTIPPYWYLQAQFGKAHARLSPVAASRIQRGLAFASAGLLAWRAAVPGHACCF